MKKWLNVLEKNKTSSGDRDWCVYCYHVYQFIFSTKISCCFFAFAFLAFVFIFYVIFESCEVGHRHSRIKCAIASSRKPRRSLSIIYGSGHVSRNLHCDGARIKHCRRACRSFRLRVCSFFAIGAYTYGIFATAQANNFMPFGKYPLSGESFWIFLIIGCIVAAIFGVLLGIPVLRVKGDYLAIVTLGFGEIIRIIFNNLDKPVNITNGAMGLASVQPPKLFGIEFMYPSQFYYVVLVILLLTIFIVRRLEYSKIGRAWKAVRENEIAAQAMGIPLVRTKLMAFAVGASFSGMMGVVFAAKQTFVDPTSFTLLESITILVMVILGGMGSVPGVILGAALVTILNLQVLTELTNWLNQLSLSGVVHIPDALSPAKMQRFIFGLILIVFALYRPQGLLPAKNPRFDEKELKSGVTNVADGKEGAKGVYFNG